MPISHTVRSRAIRASVLSVPRHRFWPLTLGYSFALRLSYMANDLLANLRVAAPCPASWEAMAGDERMRHCTLCDLNVYNFAEMTSGDIRELLARTEGRVCARLYRRADGTVLTRDCPTGLRALRRRASRAAAALVAMLLSLPGMAFGGVTCKTRGAKVKLTVERVAAGQAAVFTGIVRQDDAALPGVTVVVKDQANREVATVTDANGAFTVAGVHDGVYRVAIALSGFTPAMMEHLEVKAGEVIHASVQLRPNAVETITVGGLAPIITPEAGTTRISEYELRKLPF